MFPASTRGSRFTSFTSFTSFASLASFTSFTLAILAGGCGTEAAAGGAPPSHQSDDPLEEGRRATASTPDTFAANTAPPDAVPYSHCPDGRWCSTLYPPTWTPSAPADADGRFLHDFSYAGYRNGEPPPAAPPGETYDVVVAHRADPTGKSDATAAIQSAIDAASKAGGGVVFFPSGTYRIDGVLALRASGVVLRGTGRSSLLRFTKARGLSNKAHITVAGAITNEPARALVADAPSRAREVLVEDASGFAPGDDVAIGWTITPSFVEEHGMTGTWTAFNGQYKPFFRSRIVSVDTTSTPQRIVVDVPLRYPAKTRDGAAIFKERGYLREVGVEHLAMSNAGSWADAWAENHVGLLTMRDVTDAWVNDVHSVPPPGAPEGSDHLLSAGILIEDSKRVSVLRSSMEYPQNRGSGGNGYLFEVARTSEVLFSECAARRGRHNFIQNWGFGNSGTVFLRCHSEGSEMLSLIKNKLTPEPAMSEHHHSLAMATLVDSCTIDDGFGFENRGAYSTGAGHTATESVVWGATGTGAIRSQQYGWGYVIGTAPGLRVETDLGTPTSAETAPEDFVEGRSEGATLFPPSLYEDQRARRLGRP